MTSSTELQRCPIRREDVVVVRADGKTLLEAADSGKQHLVNPTALALWELCDGTTSTEEMIEAILVLFAVEQNVVRDDVTQALSQLTDLGLLKWR